MARTDNSGIKKPEPINLPGITEGSTTPLPGVTATATEQDGILWQPGTTLTGGPAAKRGKTADTYKSKAYAKSAFKTGTLPKSQMDVINSAYAKYGKSLGFKKASSFWTAIVDGSDSATSPFQILSQINSEGIEGVEGTGSGSGGGPTTSVNIQQYDKTLSDTLIDSTLLSTFGRKATDAEKTRFFKELNAASKAGTVTKTTRKGGKTVTTTVKKFDEKDFLGKYEGTVLEGMLAGQESVDLSGEAGKIQDTLRQYSNDMGIIRSDRDILSDVRRVIKGEVTADDAAMEVRKQAASLYKNFADRINTDSTVTVRDLVNPYIKLMADTFEQDMESISLTNPTIQNILASDKTPSYGDFYKQLRGMSEFRNTTTAQKEASTFASGLASAMGF
jgi:hypothetical protein